jgi:hypothetical protein
MIGDDRSAIRASFRVDRRLISGDVQRQKILAIRAALARHKLDTMFFGFLK